MTVMLSVYLACLVLGGILLGGSLLLGHLHANGDADGGGGEDLGGDTGGDLGPDDAGAVEHGGDHEVADAAGIWLPFLSLRFWVFTLCFFGLSGTLLTLVGTGPVPTLVIAVLVGLACGTGAAYVVHKLGTVETLGHVPASTEFVGILAQVLVPVGTGARGKVRVEVRGQAVDLVAVTADGETLATGRSALVVQYEDGVATVTKPPLEGEDGGSDEEDQ